MQLKTFLAAALAAAFALPLAAQAGGDKEKTSGASAGATRDDGGAEAMFKGLDKDKDGNLSKEEVKGTPHDKDFSKLDKNGDNKLSREEHAAADEHQKEKSSTGGSAGASSSPSSSGSSAGGSKQKY